MTTLNNEVRKPDDATLIVRRMLNATPERAFQAWTSPEHIKQSKRDFLPTDVRNTTAHSSYH
jgi:uncharacterized protein YndB with AHSA1/START domain